MSFVKATVVVLALLNPLALADGVASMQKKGRKSRPSAGRKQQEPKRREPTPSDRYLADEEQRELEKAFKELYTQVLTEHNVSMDSPGLIQALAHQDSVVKMAAAHFLGEKGERAAIPALRRLLADKDPLVKVKAADVLRRLGDSSGFAALLEESNSKDAATRLNAVSVAVGFAHTDKTPEVISLLIRALKDSDNNVRAAAAGGLGDVRGPAAIDALRQARQSETDEVVRLVIEQQLRKLEQ